MRSPENVTVLGATGSIGSSTLDVIRHNRERFRVFALSGRTRLPELATLCEEFNPRYVVVEDPNAAEKLSTSLRSTGCDAEILIGEAGLCFVASHPDVSQVMAAIVGAAGLEPTLAAVSAGKKVLLANKESLVMAGSLFMDAVRKHGATLLPIDSEHNAIFQCMPAHYEKGLDRVGVRKILLTGSGGPFRTTPLADLAHVTPEQACAHPNWSMGRKISVDSATMMNKGLELIEACWMFSAPLSSVDIVVHPQSVIHSMVEYVDGSVLAQLGNPDMRTPIAHAMAWPERTVSGVGSLDLIATARLDFEAPDLQRFPCLRLASESFAAGGTMSAALNAANEVAVQAFLDRRLRFLDIAPVIEGVLGLMCAEEPVSIEVVKRADEQARQLAALQVSKRLGS